MLLELASYDEKQTSCAEWEQFTQDEINKHKKMTHNKHALGGRDVHFSETWPQQTQDVDGKLGHFCNM